MIRSGFFVPVMAEAVELKAIESERAKQRQATSTGGATPQLMENFPQAEKSTTRDKVAQAVGLGTGRTFATAEKVWREAKQGNKLAQRLVGDIDAGRDKAIRLPVATLGSGADWRINSSSWRGADIRARGAGMQGGIVKLL